MTFEQALDQLASKVSTLALFVQRFSGTLDQPVMSRPYRGFRYSRPDMRHFCLLRACRTVSALNAAIEALHGPGIRKKLAFFIALFKN